MVNCGKVSTVFFLASFPSLLEVYEPGFLGRVNDSSLGILFIYVAPLLQGTGGSYPQGKGLVRV